MNTRRGRGKSRKSLDLIYAAIEILNVIQPASIRAVCYRLFVANVIASMAKSETNKVSTQLTWAREQGLIPWHWIVDETREVERVSAWENPEEFVRAVRRSYRRNRWTDQPVILEIWSEKGTVRGTLAPILHEYGLPFRVMHGYASATAIKQAVIDAADIRQPVHVLYVGDWDPSGLHMSVVDLPGRLAQYGGNIHLQRLALTVDDTTDPNLPSFEAATKAKDPRYRWYRDRYGTRCWELDALSPTDLRDRVERAVLARLDHVAWQRAEVVEAAEQESLSTILSAWPGISRQAQKYPEGRA